MFSTGAVEKAVEILMFVWKKSLMKKFSTFPQGQLINHLWKCGKL